MSDTGFQHLIEWLQALQASNQNLNPQEAELKTIILRANSIEGTSASATAFIDALPSTVSTLVLSNNPLSSAFRQSFFSMLHNLPHLNRLLVSMTGMDIEDAEILASYIGSKNPRCTLIELKASGNSLQYEGLTKVTNAMKVCWSIEKVDLFGNCVTSALSPDFEAFEADTPILNDIVSALSLSHDQVSRLGHGSGTGVPLLDRRLIVLLARNIHLKKEVQREAFNLLKYSRLMLRKSIINPTSTTAAAPQTQLCNDCDCMSIPGPFLSSAILGSSQTQTAQFSTLPIEIQLDILSHLAPHLSTQQRIRIFEYAVDRNTLPRLQLCLPTFKDDPLNPKNCIVDPGSLQFLNFQIQNVTGINRSGKKVGTLQRRHPHGVNLRSGSSCASGQCMASYSVLCQRQVERERWLQLVGCESYDPGE
ncbi:hypothetical protein CPC08DRAFT_752920 [Agrocybe pediades]|nr:hypothetical protein CPC08DRAFT_752920 [Agrocybe pediades]